MSFQSSSSVASSLHIYDLYEKRDSNHWAKVISVSLFAFGLLGALFNFYSPTTNKNLIQNFLVESSYMKWEYGDPPVRSRKPANAVHYTTDLFDHPVVQRAMREAGPLAQSHCGGPSNNIETWVNEDLVQQDLDLNEGFTVFNIDCRDSAAFPIVAFIVVLDMKGSVVAVHHPPIRAESVTMYSPDVVLFSTISGSGVFLWNWRENEIQKMPFPADAHTMHYRDSDHRFFGLYLDKENNAKNSPSVAMAYDANTGSFPWSFESEFSHINYLTVHGKYAYLSLRSGGCLLKVDMETNNVIWSLGGKYSNFHFYDRDGNFIDANRKSRNDFRIDGSGESVFGVFQHQHKFQHLTDSYYSLFDNNVCANSRFCNAENSRMVVVNLQEDIQIASEIFSFDTGDQARIYGGADVLPSGNILGNSYNKFVFPEDDEYKYHANIWEVTPSNEIAWRVSFKGYNPWDPQDTENAYSHSITPDEEPPVGWLIYNVERFYSKPVVTKPCLRRSEAGDLTLKTLAHNSFRTSEDMPGEIYVYDKKTRETLGHRTFDFQKSWIADDLEIELPPSSLTADIALLVTNSWQQGNLLDLGPASKIQSCDIFEVSNHRIFL